MIKTRSGFRVNLFRSRSSPLKLSRSVAYRVVGSACGGVGGGGGGNGRRRAVGGPSSVVGGGADTRYAVNGMRAPREAVPENARAHLGSWRTGGSEGTVGG